MNITIFDAQELYALGFSYRHYQNHFHKGMVYYYEGAEWVIGGNADEDISNSDMKIIHEGIWLPSEMHLIEWLVNNDFVFHIVNTDHFFEFKCKDSITGTEYSTKVPTLEVASATVIKKILKKKERTFDTKEKIFGIIEESV